MASKQTQKSLSKYNKTKKNEATRDEAAKIWGSRECMESQQDVPEWYKREIRIFKAECMAYTGEIIDRIEKLESALANLSKEAKEKKL